MNLPQPDVTAINNIINDNKCSFSTKYHNKFIEEEYFVKLCKTSILDNKSFEEIVKEKYLIIYLLENINFLNFKDEYGRTITNCDLNKIYNL